MKRNFREISSGKTELFDPYSRRVNAPLVSPPAVQMTPMQPDTPVLPSHRLGARACLQLALFIMLAWAATLCAGLGGAMGGVSQSLAAKLSANAQHLQRQAGGAQSTRAARRDPLGAEASRQLAQDQRAIDHDPLDAAQPVDLTTLRVAQERAEDQPTMTAEPRLKPRGRAHPSRAPPPLA